jgi:hypothetical protein
VVLISFKAMLRHRCQLLRLDQEPVSGSPVFGYQLVTGEDGQPLTLRCYLDLNYIRQGKDPQWSPEAGRATERSGVWFGEAGAPIRFGDRIKMLSGPLGTFEVASAIDESWTPALMHHLEIGVQEVAQQRTRASRMPQGGQRAS